MPKVIEKTIETSELAPADEVVILSESVPARDQIEVRAYEIYLQRGGADGNDVQDWLQAESELLAEAEKNSPQARATAA
ncbi:MAG TPA: DUF2934 domain-containing protein [Candidatus Acidoferrales bacterium]